MVRRAITPEDLINQWELRKIVYLQQAMETRDMDVRAIIKAFIYQLDKCIEDLSQVISGDYPIEDLLDMIISARKPEGEQ